MPRPLLICIAIVLGFMIAAGYRLDWKMPPDHYIKQEDNDTLDPQFLKRMKKNYKRANDYYN